MRLLISLAILFVITSNAYAAECKKSNFDSFLKQFSENKEFAVSRTIYPLRILIWEYGVDAQDKDVSRASLKLVSKSENKNAPILSVFLRDNGLKATVGKVTGTNAVVLVFKEGTDWLSEYHFKYKGNGWFLYEIEDKSL